MWNHLPSIIIFNIFKNLSPSERLVASSCCKSWRESLYHSSQWPAKRLIIDLATTRSLRNRRSDGRGSHLNMTLKLFVAKCARFLQELVICFNPNSAADVNDVIDILEVMAYKTPHDEICDELILNCRSLRRLTLRPANFRADSCNWNQFLPLLHVIESLIRECPQLNHLSVGCMQQMLNDSPSIISLLAQHQKDSLRCLHLASIKQDPDYYPVVELAPHLFEPFSCIKVASIDYDNVCDDLLHKFSKMGSLKSFIINVHGIDDEHMGVSKSAWNQLKRSSPSLQVILKLDGFKEVLILTILKVDFKWF